MNIIAFIHHKGVSEHEPEGKACLEVKALYGDIKGLLEGM